MQSLPDYHLDAVFRSVMADEAEALASSAATEPQMVDRLRDALKRRRSRRQLWALLAAAVLLTLMAGAIALATSRLRPPVTPDPPPALPDGPDPTPISEPTTLVPAAPLTAPDPPGDGPPNHELISVTAGLEGDDIVFELEFARDYDRGSSFLSILLRDRSWVPNQDRPLLCGWYEGPYFVRLDTQAYPGAHLFAGERDTGFDEVGTLDFTIDGPLVTIRVPLSDLPSQMVGSPPTVSFAVSVDALDADEMDPIPDSDWFPEATGSGGCHDVPLLIDPSAPTESDQTRRLDTTYEIPLGSVLVGYDDPVDWNAVLQVGGNQMGFGPGYRWSEDGSSLRDDLYVGQPWEYGNGAELRAGAHGIVISDITGAGLHQDSHQTALIAIEDAAAFFDKLRTVRVPATGDRAYDVGEVEAAEFAGRPALSARVMARPDNDYPLLENPANPDFEHYSVHLGQIQKLIVADVGQSLLLVQIWASDEATLAEWLPVAEAFVASMQVEEAVGSID